jgi:hypothetical protein
MATGNGRKQTWYSRTGHRCSDREIKGRTRRIAMSLKNPDVPAEILRAFTSGLGDYVDSSDPLWSLLLNKYIAIDALNLPLEPFRKIALDRVQKIETKLPNTGWRFLAAEGDLYGGCHVGSITSGHPPKLTGFSTAAQILTAIENYNGLGPLVPPVPPGLPGNFQPRVLRVPWLQFEAFWLHFTPPNEEYPDSFDYDHDRLVPYDGFAGARHLRLALMQAFTVNDFFEAIWPHVQEVVKRVQRIEEEKARAQALAQEAGIKALRAQADDLERKAAQAKERK